MTDTFYRNNLNRPIDNKLIQECLFQDRKSQKELYILLLPYLKSVAIRYIRDSSYLKDVLQEGFIKIFKNLNQHDSSKSNIKTWCAKIVINTCLNYNTRVIGNPYEEILEIPETESKENIDISSFSNEQLLELLKQMPYGYQEVFNLYVIDGYDHDEIASILKINSALSRKKLSRAKLWIRNAIKKKSELSFYHPKMRSV